MSFYLDHTVSPKNRYPDLFLIPKIFCRRKIKKKRMGMICDRREGELPTYSFLHVPVITIERRIPVVYDPYTHSRLWNNESSGSLTMV